MKFGVSVTDPSLKVWRSGDNSLYEIWRSGDRFLLFYSRSSPRVEVDFLFRSGIKTSPIEVKSSGYRVHASLDWLAANRKKGLGTKYVVCPGDFENDGSVTYLPFYMAHCL